MHWYFTAAASAVIQRQPVHIDRIVVMPTAAVWMAVVPTRVHCTGYGAPHP